MSYPQPSSTAAQSAGFDFFRLTTELASPGDIYESLISSGNLVVGPNSDIANVACSYFDANAPGSVSFATISPMRNLPGSIYARAKDETYDPSKRPGKILFWSDDLYNPNFTPSDQVVNGGIVIVPPVLDVIEYFDELPSVSPSRPDKTFQYQELPESAQVCFLVVPYYGRKAASVRVLNLSTDDITVDVRGVTLYMNETNLGIETPILTGAVVTNGNVANAYVTAGEFGMFHLLMVKIAYGDDSDTNTPITIIVSDQSEAPLGA